MNLDFVSAICEEFSRAIDSVVPPEFLTPQDCWDPVIEVFGKDFDSRTLVGITDEQIRQLQAAFAKWFECEGITELQMRSAISAVLRRWPAA